MALIDYISKLDTGILNLIIVGTFLLGTISAIFTMLSFIRSIKESRKRTDEHLEKLKLDTLDIISEFEYIITNRIKCHTIEIKVELKSPQSKILSNRIQQLKDDLHKAQSITSNKKLKTLKKSIKQLIELYDYPLQYPFDIPLKTLREMKKKLKCC